MRRMGRRNAACAHYARVQRLFDDGVVYQSSPRHLLGYIEEDGRWWRAAIKSTPDGLFLSTFHRAGDEEIARMARRYIRLR